MEKTDDNVIEVPMIIEKNGSCFFKLFWLFIYAFIIFLGVVISYLGYTPLKIELYSVIMIGIIFLIYLFFIKHNAYYAACKFKHKRKQMHNVMSWYINSNSLKIGDITRANAPIEKFFNDFTSSLRNDNFSSVAPSVFPTLGILGTFISIAVSMPDFSSSNSSVLEQEISILLNGVGTAFYVSIYGIFLSLLWTYFEKSGMSVFQRDIFEIKENVRHLFWSKEQIEQAHLQESLKNFKELNSNIKKLTKILTDISAKNASK